MRLSAVQALGWPASLKGQTLLSQLLSSALGAQKQPLTACKPGGVAGLRRTVRRVVGWMPASGLQHNTYFTRSVELDKPNKCTL